MKLHIINLSIIPFLITLVLLAFVGLFSYSVYNPMPVRSILDVIFILFSLTLFFYVSSAEQYFYQLIYFLGFLLSLFWMYLYGSGDVLDFLVIYKFYIYMIFLIPYAGKELVPNEKMYIFLKFLISLFLFKYLLWMVVGSFERPGLFGENNFELIFLILCYVACQARGVEVDAKYEAFIIIIFLMSQSRSALAVLLFTMAFIHLRKLDFKTLMSIIFLSILFVLVSYIFIGRLGDKGVEGIDRLRFLTFFLEDIRDFNFLQILFGTEPITALSPVTCKALEFYERLFSYTGDGSCYSVILHAFNIRVIFDHGIVGLIFLYYVLNRILVISNVTARYRLLVCGIIFLTGMSVSSMNNIFVVAGVMMILITHKSHERQIA